MTLEGMREVAAPAKTSNNDDASNRLYEDAQKTGSARNIAEIDHCTPGTSAREVYDAQGVNLDTGDHGAKIRFEGEAPSGNADADNVYDYDGKVLQFYKDVFGRNSIDDKGMNVISRINYGKNLQDAYWDGSEMTYGKMPESSPFKSFVLLDVTGHEIAHGISDYESHLRHYGQTGALNESISDVFGIMVKQWDNHQSARDSNWVFGEGLLKPDVNGRGVRDMLHPGTAFDDPKLGKDRQPDNLDHYVKTTRDNGGVHINSGIPNRAFAEFATNVGGYSWEEPGHIWYEARRDAGTNPSFAQFANATMEAAKKLGYEADLPKLERAWKDVGVTPSATEVDELTPGMFF